MKYYANVKTYNLKELCDLYTISDKTFKAWIRPYLHLIGTRMGIYYSPLQVEIIFSKLGIPFQIIEERE